jgi:hypothetical protein
MSHPTAAFLQKLVILAILLLIPVFAFAQEPEMESPAAATISDSNSTVVGVPEMGMLPPQNISVHQATIVGQENGFFSVSFVLQNFEEREQSGILYQISLLNNAGTGAEFTGTDTVTLAALESLKKTVTYPLRQVAIGDYTVLVTAKTASGEVLGQSVAGSLLVQPKTMGASVHDSEESVPATEHAYEYTDPTQSSSNQRDIHFTVTILALALALLVVLLAVGRHKKPTITTG